MKNTKLQLMTKISVLSAIAFILMYVIEFPIPFLFPDFLKIDFSDIPAILGAFALGPIPAVVIELLKNLLHLIFKSNTGGIGELANFLCGAAFVLAAGFIYQRSKTRKSAFVGLLVGTVLMALVMSLANYFILIPFFYKTAPSTSFLPLIYAAIFPFNIVKGIIVSAISLLVYKSLSPVLHR